MTLASFGSTAWKLIISRVDHALYIAQLATSQGIMMCEPKGYGVLHFLMYFLIVSLRCLCRLCFWFMETKSRSPRRWAGAGLHFLRCELRNMQAIIMQSMAGSQPFQNMFVTILLYTILVPSTLDRQVCAHEPFLPARPFRSFNASVDRVDIAADIFSQPEEIPKRNLRM